jgi:CBS domain containing-hemolysin-like protein
MESAIFSIGRFRAKTLLFENVKGAKSLAFIKENYAKTLSTLLLLNDLVNIGASSLATVIIGEILLNYHLPPIFFYIFEVVIMTFILLVFGEITPKTIALNNAEFFSLNFGTIIKILNEFTNPFTKFTSLIVHLILPAKRSRTISEEDIRQMMVEAKRLKILDETEEHLGYRILKFGRATVEEIMVPVRSVIGLGSNGTIEDAMGIIKNTGHTRLCVFDAEKKVVGVLYAKDLLLRKLSPDTVLSEVMRKPFVVLKEKPIDELLSEFRKKGVHFGVVCDTENNFLGIVTLNDVFKYLFGEIPEP